MWSVNDSAFQRFLTQCGAPVPEICFEDSSSYIIPKEMLSLICFAAQYFLPLFTMIYLYFNVGTTAHNRGNWRMQNLRREDTAGRKAVQSTQRRNFFLLSSLVVTFAILWFPFNLYMTLSAFDVATFSLTKGFAWVYLLGICQGTVNPIMYGLLNDNFRAVFRRICSKLHWRRTRNQRYLEVNTNDNINSTNL